MNGICLETCPTPFYIPNYLNYTCTNVLTPSYMTVKIQSLGFEKRFRKDKTGYLKAEIENLNTTKTITSIKWYQLDPLPLFTSVTIWTVDGSAVDIDYDDVVKLKMSAFSFMSLEQSIKVMVEVTNSAGEKAMDIAEFYVNDSPNEVGTTIQRSGGASSQEAYQTLFSTNGSQWYDKTSDTSQQLTFTNYLVLDNTRYLLTAFQFAVSTSTFRVPYLSAIAGESFDVDVCIAAHDQFDAQKSKCESFTGMTSNYDGSLMTMLSTLNLADETDALTMAQTLNFVSPAYGRTSGAPGLCSFEYHCNFNGICSRSTSLARCECDTGYGGIFCPMLLTELETLQGYASTVLTNLHTTYFGKTTLSPFEIEYITNVLGGLLVQFDYLTSDKTATVIDLMEKIANQEFTQFYPFARETRKQVLETYSRLMSKIQTEWKVILAKTSHQLTPGLGGEVKEAAEQAIRDSEASKHTRFEAMLSTVTNKISLALNPGETEYIFRSANFEVKLMSGYPPSFYGQQLYISNNDMFIETPADLTSLAQDFASDVQEVKLRMIKWIASPILSNPSESNLLETNITDITFLNTKGEEITLANLVTPLVVAAPFKKSTSHPVEFLKCKIWNPATSMFDDSNNTFQSFDAVLPCGICSVTSLTTTEVSYCRYSHLSKYGSSYDRMGVSNGQDPGVGIYTNYYALKSWRTSFGFNLIVAIVFCFFFCWILSFIVDWKTRKTMFRKMQIKIQNWQNQQAFDGEDGLILPNPKTDATPDEKKKGGKVLQKPKKLIGKKQDQSVNESKVHLKDQENVFNNSSDDTVNHPRNPRSPGDSTNSQGDAAQSQLSENGPWHDKQKNYYNLSKMLVYENLLLNYVFITTYISPRHVRFTLFFSHCLLIWFFCAVIFNNTKDPLQIPDFSRDAKVQVFSEIWVSMVAPMGVMIIMFIFHIMFKVSDQRIMDAHTVPDLITTNKELKKEMGLRLIMAYIVTWVIYATVFWYIISFTASFGWKVSWIWWYTGCFSFLFHFFMWAPLITICHRLCHKFLPKVARFFMKIRNLKIDRPEVEDRIKLE